jgi:adenylate kinase family enzyme
MQTVSRHREYVYLKLFQYFDYFIKYAPADLSVWGNANGRVIYMKLHIIIGATGSGKSKKAVHMAQEFNAPIIVLDRIQCFRDLSITSGRHLPPDQKEYGKRRIFLSDRLVADGDYPAELAYKHFREQLAALRSLSMVIVEGGSVSLTNLLLMDKELFEAHEIFFEIISRNPLEHREMVIKRVTSMLTASESDGQSMITELADVWKHTEHRPFIQSISGLDAILSWLTENGFEVENIPGYSFSRSQFESLCAAVAKSHLLYAQSQKCFINDSLGNGLYRDIV